MNLTSSVGYHVVGQSSGSRRHGRGHQQRRLLEIVRVVSMVYISLGLLTTIIACVLVTVGLGEPKFTFSTGLPLMVGVLETVGSMILCCISVKESRFVKYTSREMCKWQCSLLFFCFAGVIVLGCTSLVLTIAEEDINVSLVKHTSRVPTFPLGVVSTFLIVLNVSGSGIILSIFCFYNQSSSRMRAYQVPPIHHNAYIENEITFRLMALRELLPKAPVGHLVMPQHPGVHTHLPQKQFTVPQIDRKGYYVWDAK